MKKFKFRLQSVLDARAKELENKQIELSIVQAKLKKQLQDLENIQNAKSSTKQNLEKLISQGSEIDFFLVEAHRNYIQKLSNDIQKQKTLIKQTEIEVKEKTQEVIEALKAKTMLEKLKEKDLKEFLITIEQYEQKELDDIATSRHLMKN